MEKSINQYKSTHLATSTDGIIISSYERKFDAICLSGGGTKGLLQLGCLQFYYENGLYDPNFTHTYIATSVGVIICLLLVCGYTPLEIFTEICTTEHFVDIKDFNNIYDIFENMGGILPINVVSNKVLEMVTNKLSSPPFNFQTIPTLQELYKLTNKKLIITVANVSEINCEYWSFENQPNLNCIEAIENACRIPFVFPRKYLSNNLCYIVDGALMDNFPLKYIDDGKIKILGIVITGIDLSQSDEHFLGYFQRLMAMPIRANTELRCQLASENTTLVKLEYNDASLLEFNMSKEKKINMYLHGFNTAEQHKV